MKTRIRMLALLAATVVAIPMSHAQVQKKAKMSPSEIMAALKPGQWVQMEGIVQKNMTVLTEDIEVLTGDFLDDQWEITGIVRQVNLEKQEFKLLTLPIKTQKDTEFESDTSPFTSFSSLKDGMLVEVDGTHLKDGTFLAREIEDVSAELAAEPELQNQIEAVGKIERIDLGKQTITMLGTTFFVIKDTELKTAVK